MPARHYAHGDLPGKVLGNKAPANRGDNGANCSHKHDIRHQFAEPFFFVKIIPRDGIGEDASTRLGRP